MESLKSKTRKGYKYPTLEEARQANRDHSARRVRLHLNETNYRRLEKQLKERPDLPSRKVSQIQAKIKMYKELHEEVMKQVALEAEKENQK